MSAYGTHFASFSPTWNKVAHYFYKLYVKVSWLSKNFSYTYRNYFKTKKIASYILTKLDLLSIDRQS